MQDEYYIIFGLRASGVLEFTIRCNIIMKKLSYVYRRYSDYELVQISIQLTDDDIEKIKPYINSKNFECYRAEKIKYEPFMPYLDDWTMEFEGITGSEIPILKLSSDDYAWDMQPPVEKLFLFLKNNFFSKN